jgi:uncharacterized protein (TIGR02246 family)
MRQPIARRSLLVAAVAATAASATAGAQPADEPARVMDRYAAALAANDLEALVALYTDNGVFVRPEMAPAVGREALRQAYRQIFATLKVNLKFTVHEVEIAGDVAWLRSSSAGRVKVLATGVESADSYHQLVVFRREATGWKIRNYLYAPANPATPAKS